MKFYLSSYLFGSETEKLQSMRPAGNNRVGYVPNARDFTGADPLRFAQRNASDIAGLEALGLRAEMLDLRRYFGRQEELRNKLEQLGMLWVSGGNVFVLRQAMALSGLDDIVQELQTKEDFLYGGYSAGCCVLSPSLTTYAMVDKPEDTPYEGHNKVLWDGLAILPFAFLPHYRSEHPESADVEKEVQKCIEQKVLFKAFRDGEVLIVE